MAALLLGGTPVLAAVAFVSTAIIYAVNVRLSQWGLPYFFQQVVGGFLATLPAALIYRLSVEYGWDVQPYRVIVAGIIVLMAGLSLVGSVQDAITGAPVTGAARFFEVVVFTGGVVAGVGMALSVTAQLGATLPPLRGLAGNAGIQYLDDDHVTGVEQRLREERQRLLRTVRHDDRARVPAQRRGLPGVHHVPERGRAGGHAVLQRRR